MKTFVIAGHSYSAQDCIDDILINPVLPDDFDSTPIDARTEEHIAAWYNLPYIVVKEYQADTYRDYCDRCLSTFKPMTVDAFMLVIADNEKLGLRITQAGKRTGFIAFRLDAGTGQRFGDWSIVWTMP
ncbi:MAG: hypothetical protein WCP01_14190 [Methylococcaceae bacterium]